MIEIKCTYKGKQYRDIMDATMVAMVDGIKESISKSISKFEGEIRECGGSVVIDIPDNLQNMQVRLLNMPEDLISRITNELR